MNEEKPYSPLSKGQSQAPRWYCQGFNKALSSGDLEEVDVKGSDLNGLAVNRVCGGTYRAY